MTANSAFETLPAGTLRQASAHHAIWQDDRSSAVSAARAGEVPVAVTASCSGEELAEIFAANHNALTGWARYLLSDRGLGEQVVQEAFEKVFKRRHEIDPSTALSYIKTVIYRDAKKARRRAVVEARLVDSAVRSGFLPGDRGHSPTDLAVEESYVLGLIQALPNRQKAVVWLRYHDELPEAEIAAILGLSVGTVKSHLARAKRSLRRARKAEDAKI